MPHPVLMPKKGNSVEECVIVAWKVKEGDRVEAGQPLAEIETDKATFEVEAPAAGQVLKLLRAAGDLVPVLNTIAVLGEPGESYIGESALPVPPLPSGEGRGEGLGKGRVEGNALTTPTATAVQTPPPSSQPSPTAGGKRGNAVEGRGENRVGASAPLHPLPLGEGRGEGVCTGTGKLAASPRARHLAAETGVELKTLKGSGPGGRIIERDVAAAPRMSPLARAVAAEKGWIAPNHGAGDAGRVQAGDLVAPATAAGPEFEEFPLSGVRKRIAERMMASLQGSAQLTLSATANATALLKLRAGIKERGKELGLGAISINDMVNFAVVRTLLRHPGINGTLSGGVVRKYRTVHLAFACNTDKGLLVPVIPAAERLALSALAEAARQLAEAARTGAIEPDRLQGGTFTVSNLGQLGITSFTPVLNPPQVAILGVGGIEPRPVRQANGEVAFEDHLHLSLTIDHQVVDGWTAGLFLKDLKAAIEDFELLLVN